MVSTPNRTIAAQSHDARNRGDQDPYNPVLATENIRDHRADNQEQEVDDPDKPVVAPLTAFENYVLAACPRVKVMPEKVRPDFHERVKWLDRYNEEHESPSVNELWETNPDFQRFVKEIIVDELRDKRWLTPTGFRKWLVSTKGYARFYGWARYNGEYTDGPDSIDPEQFEVIPEPSVGPTWVTERVNEVRRRMNGGS